MPHIGFGIHDAPMSKFQVGTLKIRTRMTNQVQFKAIVCKNQ